MRKMIHVSMASNEALQALAAETKQSFQDLIDEAITDLLKKHKRPVTLKDMLRESLDAGQKEPSRPKRRRPA
jgi:antitoxin-like ribbon-helix-helix protein